MQMECNMREFDAIWNLFGLFDMNWDKVIDYNDLLIMNLF